MEALPGCIPNNACGCDPRGGGRVRPVVGGDCWERLLETKGAIPGKGRSQLTSERNRVLLGFGAPLLLGIQNSHALFWGEIHRNRLSSSLRMMLSQIMSLPSWWIHYHCSIDQVPVMMPLQGTLVSKGFLPAYIMALER